MTVREAVDGELIPDLDYDSQTLDKTVCEAFGVPPRPLDGGIVKMFGVGGAARFWKEWDRSIREDIACDSPTVGVLYDFWDPEGVDECESPDCDGASIIEEALGYEGEESDLRGWLGGACSEDDYSEESYP